MVCDTSIEMHFVQAMTPWPGLIHGFHEGRKFFFFKKALIGEILMTCLRIYFASNLLIQNAHGLHYNRGLNEGLTLQHWKIRESL